jgi:hypothetical protein
MADAFRAARERTVDRCGRNGAWAHCGLRGKFCGTLIRHQSCRALSGAVFAHAVAMVQATGLAALVAGAHEAETTSPGLVATRARAVQLPSIIATAEVEDLAASWAVLLAIALVQGARGRGATKNLRRRTRGGRM